MASIEILEMFLSPIMYGGMAYVNSLSLLLLGCKFSGRDKDKVLAHCQTHLQEKKVACPHCGRRFSNNTKLKDHLDRQVALTSDPALTCTFCHKCFPNARLLRDHAHKHINSIKCPHCELTCHGKPFCVF